MTTDQTPTGELPGDDATTKAGYVAIVGRPNVGKSTFMNTTLGQKISIVAAKPQTTRHQILGIKTTDEGQIVFIDTPGIHQGGARAINRYMNRAARALFSDVDVVLWLVDARGLTDEDEAVGQQLTQVETPVFLAINKVDLVADKSKLLPMIERLHDSFEPAQIFPISALKAKGLDDLEKALMDALPFSRPVFNEDEITDRSQRFLAAELIREQLIHRTHEELPYSTTVEIERFKREGKMLRINGLIWVERDGQKAIVIGKRGENLKAIGTRARLEMQELFQMKVHLELWVKVKRGWSDDERALKAFGYTD